MRANEFINEEAKAAKYNGLLMKYAFNDNELLIKAYTKEGPLAFVRFTKEDKELYPQNLWVHDEYRSRGIAKSMYDYLKSEGYIINRSHDQTKAGAGFWDKHRGEDVRVWEDASQEYLWHGSRQKIPMLEPRQSVDTGGAAGSNQNAIYATSDPKVAIAMGLTTPGSDTGMFPNDPQMVLFSGKIRKGENVYLHKLPFNGPDGKPQFVQGGNSREYHTIPSVKGIKPVEIKAVPVDKYLNLIRQATPADLELRKKYMKQEVDEQVIDEMPLPADWDTSQMRQGATTFKSRLAYALERAKKLGTGSSRVATVIEYQGRPTVLKIAKNQKGLAQNSVEADILSDGYASQLGILIPIIDYDEQNREPSWVHTEMATKANEGKLCSLMKCNSLSGLVYFAEVIAGRYPRTTAQKVIDDMINDGKSEEDIEIMTDYANKLADLKNSFDVELGDFARAANWGIYQGKPVIVDVGFNSNVLNQYYREEVAKESGVSAAGGQHKWMGKEFYRHLV
jgi:hypothetical protein